MRPNSATPLGRWSVKAVASKPRTNGLARQEFARALETAGFQDVEIRETHRVHEHAASAIIRARKPPA